MRDNFMKIGYSFLFLFSLVLSLIFASPQPGFANQSPAAQISITHLSTLDGDELSHQSQCQIVNKDGVVVWVPCPPH